MAMVLLLLCLAALACKGFIACKGKASNGSHVCKGTSACKGPLLLVAALSAIQPTASRPWMCWWRVRRWRRSYWYVHEDQEWKELEPEYEEALLEAMQEEPEMADYIHGHSQLGGEVPTFPPTWQISSQQWLISGDDPDPRLVTVAQPLDVQVWVQQHYPRAGYASHSSVDHTPDWSTGWKTATHTSPNQGYSYARDGNRHTMVSSDGTIHVWTDSSHPNRWGRARSKSPTSNWQQQPWRESQEWHGQP